MKIVSVKCVFILCVFVLSSLAVLTHGLEDNEQCKGRGRGCKRGLRRSRRFGRDGRSYRRGYRGDRYDGDYDLDDGIGRSDGSRFQECTKATCQCKDASQCEYHYGDRWNCPFYTCKDSIVAEGDQKCECGGRGCGNTVVAEISAGETVDNANLSPNADGDSSKTVCKGKVTCSSCGKRSCGCGGMLNADQKLNSNSEVSAEQSAL